MLFNETIALYCEKDKRCINTICRESEKYLNDKAIGTQSDCCV
jgi:hypothetical protein